MRVRTFVDPLHENFNLFGLRRMFYLVSPNETSFSSIEQTPNYADEATVWYFVFILFELGCDFFQHGGHFKFYSFNDSICSLMSGVLHMTTRCCFKYAELAALFYVYDNFRLCTLAWDFWLTWLAALLLTDFFYYWLHRATHECNLLWALHQVHHNSEQFNFTTALRQGMFQQYAKCAFHLPAALLVPPQLIFVHNELNMIVQVLAHTQTVPKLHRWVELLLNTPSHHRVHHGRNAACLDKNYGGFLIVWDRLFGTFQPELDHQPVLYGLVGHRVLTFDAAYSQTYYFRDMLIYFRSMDTWKNGVLSVLKPPGWIKDPPYLVAVEEAAYVEPYHVPVCWPIKVYISLHFAFSCYVYYIFTVYGQDLPIVDRLPYLMFVLLTAVGFGFFLDGKENAGLVELLRCLLLYGWALTGLPSIVSAQLPFLHTVGLSHILFWLTYSSNRFVGFESK